MGKAISSKELNALLTGTSQFGLIDVREPGEYNSSHIPGSSLIPRRELEFQMPKAVPFKSVHLVLCDDDERRARLAASTMERMGYRKVQCLEGGINRWMSEGYPTEWGTNVPSKDFGEKVEVVHSVPELDASDLHDRMERGDNLVILDTRTPEEFRRFCIPEGQNVPGGELALRITDLVKDLAEDTTIVVNCAGRTRSIIGTRVLQRMGFPRVYGLKNGTSGWVLAGCQVERGADRTLLPDVTQEGLAAAETHAADIATEDGVRYLGIKALQLMMSRRDRETIYLIDVRTREEYEQGHIPGFRWFPGGQAVQRSDEAIIVHNSVVIFACDRKARATFTASWYRQMGFEEVYAMDGGTTDWIAAGMELEKGMPDETPFGLAEARAEVSIISPEKLAGSAPMLTIFVDTSQDFAHGHVPGSRWVPRGWLEIQVNDITSSKKVPIAVTCTDGRSSILAGATLKQLGYPNVLVMDGGMDAWRTAGLQEETGLSGVMASPMDVVTLGVDRTPAEMMNYLRWETALGEKYAEGQTHEKTSGNR